MESALIYFGLVVIAVLFLFPVLFTVQASFKNTIELTTLPPKIFFAPTLRHYWITIVQNATLVYYINSLVVTVASVIIVVFLGSLAAFGLAAFQYRSRDSLSFTILSMRMLPRICVVLPFFLLIVKLGLLNTKTALIIVYTVFNLPFTIYILEGFFGEVPKELRDAALIDGCNYLEVFRRVYLPLSGPGLVATASFCFIFTWNEFLFALVLTSNERAMTAPVEIASVVSLYGVDWGDLSAMATIAALPVVLFLFVVQRYMVRGLTMGALKG
jgi:multiple sugar transport system permease protein